MSRRVAHAGAARAARVLSFSRLSRAASSQEHQYRLWRFGDFTVLTRCREHALLPSSTPGAPACSAVVRVKLEYAPQLGWEVRLRVSHAPCYLHD